MSSFAFKKNENTPYPEHDGFDLDVKVGWLCLLEGETLDGLLQVEREGVEPQQCQWVQVDLHRVNVGEELGRRHWTVSKTNN